MYVHPGPQQPHSRPSGRPRCRLSGPCQGGYPNPRLCAVCNTRRRRRNPSGFGTSGAVAGMTAQRRHGPLDESISRGVRQARHGRPPSSPRTAPMHTGHTFITLFARRTSSASAGSRSRPQSTHTSRSRGGRPSRFPTGRFSRVAAGLATNLGTPPDPPGIGTLCAGERHRRSLETSQPAKLSIGVGPGPPGQRKGLRLPSSTTSPSP